MEKQILSDLSGLKKGKMVIDIQIENALLMRALEYEFDEIKEKYEQGTCTEKTVTKKHIVPDTTAQNRKMKEWGGQHRVSSIFQV